ncbi:MAG: 3'-5' exonuclease [Gammaproteobacteria bacterium]
MRQLLIIDTETTGLEPSEGAHVIEIGAILFDVKQREVVSQISFLLPTLSNEAEHINRIKPELTMSAPDISGELAKSFWCMVDHADYAVAHNAEFDSKWFGDGGCLPPMPLPWICTMDGVKWPKNTKRGRPSVTSLALDYGVPVWSAHRALTDCIYLAEVMKREPELEQILKESLEPREVYVSCLPYELRNQCKDAGFSWNTIVAKKWAKRMTRSEAQEVPFQIRRHAV